MASLPGASNVGNRSSLDSGRLRKMLPAYLLTYLSPRSSNGESEATFLFAPPWQDGHTFGRQGGARRSRFGGRSPGRSMRFRAAAAYSAVGLAEKEARSVEGRCFYAEAVFARVELYSSGRAAVSGETGPSRYRFFRSDVHRLCSSESTAMSGEARIAANEPVFRVYGKGTRVWVGSRKPSFFSVFRRRRGRGFRPPMRAVPHVCASRTPFPLRFFEARGPVPAGCSFRFRPTKFFCIFSSRFSLWFTIFVTLR